MRTAVPANRHMAPTARRTRRVAKARRPAGVVLILLTLGGAQQSQPPDTTVGSDSIAVADTPIVAVMPLLPGEGTLEGLGDAHIALGKQLSSVGCVRVLPNAVLEEFFSTCTNLMARQVAGSLSCEVAPELFALLEVDILLGGAVGRQDSAVRFGAVVREKRTVAQCDPGDDAPTAVFTAPSVAQAFGQSVAWLEKRLCSARP